MKKSLVLGCFFLVAGLPAFAGPILIQNPSFEIPTSAGTFNTVNAGDSTSIPGWLVSMGSVDHIANYWVAADGVRSIDLDGNSQGAIQQDLVVSQTGTLTVKFDMAGNPDGGLGAKSMQVSLLSSSSAPQVYTFSVTGAITHTAMGWQSETANFNVSAPGTYSLEFMSLTPGFYGPALDNVSASIPDGSSVLLLLGIGMTLLSALRRKLC